MELFVRLWCLDDERIQLLFPVTCLFAIAGEDMRCVRVFGQVGDVRGCGDVCESNDDGGGVVCSSAFPNSYVLSCTFVGRAFV